MDFVPWMFLRHLQKPWSIKRYFCNYLINVRHFGSSCRPVVTYSITRFPTHLNRCKPIVYACRIPNSQPPKWKQLLFEYDIQLTKFPRFLVNRTGENTRKVLALLKIAKCDYLISHVFLSVRPSFLPSFIPSFLPSFLSFALTTWNNSVPNGRILMKFDSWIFFENLWM
jgi:hypothetical protein